MTMVELDAEMYERLESLAAESGKLFSAVLSRCLGIGLEIAEVSQQIERFAILTPHDRKLLATKAGNLATDAQLLAFDAEDGGYDWSPDSPPGTGSDPSGVAASGYPR